MRGGPFLDTGKDARPPTRKMSASSLEDFSSSRALEDAPETRRPRLKRADTWAAAPRAKATVPKLQLPGLPGTGRPRPKTATEASEKDTAKLLEEVQAMQAALKQEEDQVSRLREALSEKDTNASSSDNKEAGTLAPKAKKKGGILPSWMRNIIDKANQLMKPAATEFFPDKPYSQQRFVVETVESPGTGAGGAGGQIRRTSFVRRNSFRASSSGRLTKSRTIGNLESLDHSVSQASLLSDAKERRRNSSVPAHMAHMARVQNSMDSEDPRTSRTGDTSPKDTGRRTRKTRRHSEVRPF